MKKICVLLVLLALAPCGVFMPEARAQSPVVADGFWKNWYVQADLDMSLQNPYGYDFSQVFPNGYSFGLDLAVGKWFSHQAGVRGKFNWENKLPLLYNPQANWLAPFGQPGINREKGGYIALYGDVLLNLHNIFGTYRPERVWNLSFYPRVGLNYNFGVEKGSLTVGMGFLNTWRLSPHVELLADAAYMMIGSGFVGDNGSGGTGTGSNSNGYFSVGLGVQYNLEGRKTRAGVLTGGFWDNWFVQGGLDMSLMNPYGCNFSQVIPKGQTFGLNAAFGKRFTPEFAFRARVQWDNGLIPNKKLEWVPPVEDPGQNYRAGGLGVFTVEAVLNLSHAIAGYKPDRKWLSSFYARAGIISQFAVGAASPVLGIGFEQAYRLNDRLSLFGAIGYQVTTSEGLGVSTTGMSVSLGTNGFFNNDLGVIIDLGDHRFYETAEQKALAAQSPARYNWARILTNTAASVGFAWLSKVGLKAVIKEERPDHSDYESFPSGHAALAFAGATSLHKAFGKDCVWVSVAGFAAATAVGVERVVNKRHYWYDVVAGAALGFGLAELTWWASDKIFGNGLSVGFGGTVVDVSYRF